MPFLLRVTETPSLNRLLELEQIVIVDKTGPVIPLGVSPGATCLVGEFLKGPFFPREVTSVGDLTSTFGGVSNLLSQAADGTQDGTGFRYEGNGAVALLGNQYRRLILQRIDNDVVTTNGGTTKAYLKFSVTIAVSDQDPLDVTRTGKDIVISGGTRFTDDATTQTKIVALSQDIVIPKGTKIRTTNIIVISSLAVDTGAADDEVFNVSQSPDGLLTLNVLSTGFPALLVPNSIGPTLMFTKGIIAAIAEIDTVLDATIPNVLSTIAAAGISTVNLAGAATEVDAVGTGAGLEDRIEQRYTSMIDRTRPNGSPQEDITVIFAARRGEALTSIRTPLQNNAIDSSNESRGREAIVSGPRVGSVIGDAASASAAKTEVQSTTTTESPGRLDRKLVTFPYVKVFSSDLNKLVTVAPSGFLATLLAQLPEEVNPGVRNTNIQAIQEFEDAFRDASTLAKQDYINFKAKGVACLRKDRSAGWLYQSGITSVDPAVDPTRAPIKRRRMADFIQDTISSIATNYNKEPATVERTDQLAGEIDAFLSSLKSPPNPSQKRIEDFSIDTKSGNTPQLIAQGIFTIIVKVRLLASLDTLVFETQIGETVEP